MPFRQSFSPVVVLLGRWILFSIIARCSHVSDLSCSLFCLLAFRWWEPVYYSTNNGFPSTSPEKTGRWVGVADHQGDALTYLILTDDTNQVLARSSVRSALDPTNPNLRAAAPLSTTDLISDGGELEPSTTLGGKPILHSSNDIAGNPADQSELKLPRSLQRN